jgi:hypothetical protein
MCPPILPAIYVGCNYSILSQWVVFEQKLADCCGCGATNVS